MLNPQKQVEVVLKNPATRFGILFRFRQKNDPEMRVTPRPRNLDRGAVFNHFLVRKLRGRPEKCDRPAARILGSKMEPKKNKKLNFFLKFDRKMLLVEAAKTKLRRPSKWKRRAPSSPPEEHQNNPPPTLSI